MPFCWPRRATGALCCLSLCLSLPACAADPPPSARAFVNPISPSAPDPWIVHSRGFYFMTSTAGNRVAIRKAATLAGLGQAEAVTIWRGGGPGYEKYTRDIWAPELHWLNGRWYVYYAATDGPDANRRIFALEGITPDPQGPYLFKGKVAVPGDDAYAIDGTIFQARRGALFFLWSGRETATGGAQNIYIAPMLNPWMLNGPRVRLSTPEFAWERHGWQVNEGPEVLQRGEKTFIVYSASGYTMPDYCLGMLTHTDGTLLDAKTWRKSPVPVFVRYSGRDGAVYGPGHNGFFRSPDGREDWIVYHGREAPASGRAARAQTFTWNADGTPNFGHPIPAGVRLRAPSGEASPAKTPSPVGAGR